MLCERCDQEVEVELVNSGYCAWCTMRLEDLAAEKAAKPKRHTYINTLMETVELQNARIRKLEDQIQEVVLYLSLDKFSVDTTVSKYDILRLLGRY